MPLHRTMIHPAILGNALVMSLTILLTTTDARSGQPSDTSTDSSQSAMTASSTATLGALKPGPAWNNHRWHDQAHQG